MVKSFEIYNTTHYENMIGKKMINKKKEKDNFIKLFLFSAQLSQASQASNDNRVRRVRIFSIYKNE